MKYIPAIIAVSLWLAAQPALAALNILACEPEWAALAKELGGDKVSVYAATTALQDPHRVEARPSLIARARSADLMVCTGAELEVGWVPLLQSQAGNPKIQPNQKGYFEAAMAVPLIDVPTRVDRSLGDVHPAGNPHLHLNPANIAKVASALTERMAQLDAPEAAYYRDRAKSFLERWQTATVRWEQEGAPLKGLPLVVYHKDLSYLVRWLGMREVGALEPKPGLPPTTAHLSELLSQLAKDPAKVVVRSAYNDPRAAAFIAERARIPVVLLPYTVGGTERAKDLFGLYDDTLSRLLAVTK
ncbi:MAG: periplasmic solute-binding protein [Betaproteobacteria bacterium]|jgi:zinc/manganese transport system substrate-binding protein|nr:periplasmic solute-binding protein [Betaproteobacteria bacterium]MEA3156780.1 zinc/manganese transport system substrate-binding protein [Betaproteobacteria bacterium]